MDGAAEIAKETVLDVENLTIAYETRKGDVEAVRNISFTVREGETIGLVGESGCGKSTIAFGIVNFLGPNGKIVEGNIRFQEEELVGRSERELKSLRGDKIAMVYQEPMQALNPSVRLGQQLTEALTFHQHIARNDAWERSIQMLKRVNMPDPEDVMYRYTHQISGGQQQRVVIAMAMLNNPSLLIIHNLGVVSRVSDQLCVMYAGQIVERGPVTDIFRNPHHPYTMGLLDSIPRLGESKAESVLHSIRGRVPPPNERPMNECIFAPRCDYATDECRKALPAFVEISPEHVSRCIYAREIESQPRTAKKRHIVKKCEPTSLRSPERELLSFEDLKIYYPKESQSVVSLLGLGEKKFVKAVDDVSVRLSKGKTLGVVGESGCGKSTLVKGIIGLEPITSGDVEFLGIDIDRSVSERDTNLIKEMQMVFQNPDSTLNPSYSIGKQISRPIRRFKTVPNDQVQGEVIRLLKAVRLDEVYYDRLPRQLSGGEKQRVGIARALASRPDLIICDEPVSALDVSVQAAVINLLLEIQEIYGSSMIFIAHDLSVVRFFSDDIAVMYLGQIVEIGPAEAIYSPPYHPYTEALLSAVPIPDPDAEQKQIRLGGNVPSALNPPSGCRFHTRCPRRKEMLPDNSQICEKEVPPWRSTKHGHRIFCHIPLEKLKTVEPIVHSSE